MLALLTLFAQEEARPEGPGLFQYMPLILIAIVFYFLIFLPSRKEKQRQQAMVNAVKKNDKVVTNAGIIGTIVHLDEGGEEVTIKSDETKLKVLKSSIFRVLVAKDTAKEETNIAVKK